MFKFFKILMLQGLIAARKHQDKLVQLVETSLVSTLCVCLFVFGPAFKARTRIKFLHSK